MLSGTQFRADILDEENGELVAKGAAAMFYDGKGSGFHICSEFIDVVGDSGRL